MTTAPIAEFVVQPHFAEYYRTVLRRAVERGAPLAARSEQRVRAFLDPVVFAVADMLDAEVAFPGKAADFVIRFQKHVLVLEAKDSLKDTDFMQLYAYMADHVRGKEIQVAIGVLTDGVRWEIHIIDTRLGSTDVFVVQDGWDLISLHTPTADTFEQIAQYIALLLSNRWDEDEQNQ